MSSGLLFYSLLVITPPELGAIKGRFLGLEPLHAAK